jgi:hypothetical protein
MVPHFDLESGPAENHRPAETPVSCFFSPELISVVLFQTSPIHLANRWLSNPLEMPMGVAFHGGHTGSDQDERLDFA